MRHQKSDVERVRDDFDADDVEVFGTEAAVADPIEAVAGVTDSLDDDLIEADLGERDEFVAADDDDEDLDELLEFDDDDSDDQEIMLLQELGVDLDAADPPSLDLDLNVSLGDDDSDDGVAA